MSNTDRIAVNDLKAFCVETMLRSGVSAGNAEITAEALVTPDTWGTFTHGTKLLKGYLTRMRAGGIDAKANPEIVRSGPAWSVVDGHSGLGPVTSVFAMDLAMEKAKACGLGMAAVRNSCHFGAAGYYASLGLKYDMLTESMANDIPSVAAPGSRGPVMGSNPFAYAAPAGEEKPLLLDMSTGAVAGGKVNAAFAKGEQVPPTWIIDSNGMPTTDPADFGFTKWLQPMAAHKGYGLALLIETLSGLISGAGVSREILAWMWMEPSKPTGHGHAFIAVDVGAMVGIDEFKSRMDRLIKEIKALPKADGSDRIYLPGEMEWERRDDALANGIPLPVDVRDSLRGLAGDVGMSAAGLLGKD